MPHPRPTLGQESATGVGEVLYSSPGETTMNSSEDWDVIWKWHWFRRPLWQPHFQDPEHPEGRPARRAPIWREVLQQYGAQHVLDANCGLGLRAILLQKAGLNITGTDVSATAIQHARELAEFHSAPIRFEHCPWTSLGTLFKEEFDAVITDAIPWVIGREQLRFAFHNFGVVLKAGGVVVFTGADQHSNPADRARRAEAAWHQSPRFQIRANYGHGGTHMTLVVARDRDGLAIIEHFLFVVHENGTARLEVASIRNTLEWSWDDFREASGEAGFGSLSTVRVMAGSREHHVNVARK